MSVLDPAVEVQVSIVVVVAEVARAKEAFTPAKEPGWQFNGNKVDQANFLATFSHLPFGPLFWALFQSSFGSFLTSLIALKTYAYTIYIVLSKFLTH